LSREKVDLLWLREQLNDEVSNKVKQIMCIRGYVVRLFVDGVRNDDLREKKQVEEEVYDVTP
jgi:hypothetical protein